MADYFTHFSCLLDVGTPENAARALDLYNQLSEDGASEDPPSDNFLLSIQPEHGGTQLWMRAVPMPGCRARAPPAPRRARSIAAPSRSG